MNIYVVTHPTQEIHSPVCRDLRSSKGETHRETLRGTLEEIIAKTPDAKVMACTK